MLSDFYWTMSYRSRPTSTLQPPCQSQQSHSPFSSPQIEQNILRKKIKRNHSEFYFLSSIICSFCRKDAILVYLKLQNLPTLYSASSQNAGTSDFPNETIHLPFTSCEMVVISLYIFSLSHCFPNSCQPITKHFSSSQPTYNLYRPYIYRIYHALPFTN